MKQEVYRVAERHALKGTALKVFVVNNSPIAVLRDEMIERVVVGGGMDEADNWIADRAGRGDVVVTADVPLASRCVKKGATVLAPNGKPFSEDSIGMTLATRNLLDSLRSAGAVTGGPKPFAPRAARIFSPRSIRRWCGSSATGLGDQRAGRRDGHQSSARPRESGDPAAGFPLSRE